MTCRVLTANRKFDDSLSGDWQKGVEVKLLDLEPVLNQAARRRNADMNSKSRDRKVMGVRPPLRHSHILLHLQEFVGPQLESTTLDVICLSTC